MGNDATVEDMMSWPGGPEAELAERVAEDARVGEGIKSAHGPMARMMVAERERLRAELADLRAMLRYCDEQVAKQGEVVLQAGVDGLIDLWTGKDTREAWVAQGESTEAVLRKAAGLDAPAPAGP